VADATYFFVCSRYIELNPVRAGMVRDPADYLWSSFAHNALGRQDPTITAHDAYLALGSNPIRRRAAYLELFASRLEPTELARLRADVRGRPNPDASKYREAVELSGRWRGEPSRDALTLGASIRTTPGVDERYMDVTSG
jgi:putative transposase